MAQIGTIRVDTQNNGTVSVPVFDTGDSGSSIYEFVRVQTGSGTGFIPVEDTSNATYPYLRVQSQSHGTVAMTDRNSSISNSSLAQDLLAWYRFEDGDARDYTNDLDATFADSTAFDGSINGATFQSTAGVTDFNTGANSGAFDFAGGDGIRVPEFDLNQGTVMAWFEVDTIDDGNIFAIGVDVNNFLGFSPGDSEFLFREKRTSGDTDISTPETLTTGTYAHLVWSTDGSNLKAWFNGEPYGPVSGSENLLFDEFGSPYNASFQPTRFELDGRLDDVRVYNRQLTDSEVSNIYNATKP